MNLDPSETAGSGNEWDGPRLRKVPTEILFTC
jgi:hypothetical protein